MALTTLPTAAFATGSVGTSQLANDAVDNTKLDLADDYAFTGTITGTPLIGDGQSWQDVLSSRSTGVTYTNNTGKPIIVAIYTARVSSGTTCFIDVDGLRICGYRNSDNNESVAASQNCIVPNGSTYVVNVNVTLDSWKELR